MRILSFVASYLVAYAVVQLGDDSFFDRIVTTRRSTQPLWTFLPRPSCLELPLPAAVPSPLS